MQTEGDPSTEPLDPGWSPKQGSTTLRHRARSTETRLNRAYLRVHYLSGEPEGKTRPQHP